MFRVSSRKKIGVFNEGGNKPHGTRKSVKSA